MKGRDVEECKQVAYSGRSEVCLGALGVPGTLCVECEFEMKLFCIGVYEAIVDG